MKSEIGEKSAAPWMVVAKWMVVVMIAMLSAFAWAEQDKDRNQEKKEHKTRPATKNAPANAPARQAAPPRQAPTPSPEASQSGRTSGGRSSQQTPAHGQDGRARQQAPKPAPEASQSGWPSGGRSSQQTPAHGQDGRAPTPAPEASQSGRTSGGRSSQQTPAYGQSGRRGQQPSARGPESGADRFRGATATTQPSGRVVYSHRDGRQWEVGQRGQVTHFSKPGVDARFTERGRLSSAHLVRPDHSEMTIRRVPRGGRVVTVVRPDHTRIVVMGAHRGYVERPIIVRPGYISRTYVFGGRPYARVYRTYHYRSVVYYRYVPAFYYRPAFYGWAFNPWRTPVVFRWGWASDPWYGYYGPYFAPAPVYPSAALWLTDYLLAENLRLAYENRQLAAENRRLAEEQAEYADTALPLTSSSTITPEMKMAIAEEVKQQLADERALAEQPAAMTSQASGNEELPPPALDPKQRIFIVSTPLEVNAGGDDCALTPGDILVRTGDTMEDGNKVAMSVMSSKAGDCRTGANTAIEVAELQEMHNRFREQIGTGLKALADNQGKGGVPAGPAADPREVAEGQATPDAGAESQLSAQFQEAEQAESAMKKAAEAE